LATLRSAANRADPINGGVSGGQIREFPYTLSRFVVTV
jgi:hypothetical protein